MSEGMEQFVSTRRGWIGASQRFVVAEYSGMLIEILSEKPKHVSMDQFLGAMVIAEDLAKERSVRAMKSLRGCE